MFASAIQALVIVVLTAGFFDEVIFPAGEYAIEKSTEAYDAGKELYQEKVIGTD
jgi:hypothetical protein